MRKALIITYYWPPSGGSSVLRWLKFTKYLREFGWEPVIYTPENPESQEIDELLLREIPENIEILKTKIREPYTLYKWITGRKKEERLGVSLMSDKKVPGIITRLSLWVRSNLFIPDPRCLWINPSVKQLSRYLSGNPVDIIITTGPPHSMHLIGLGLKKKLGIKWLADFRDPWTNIDFYSDLLLTRFADRKHKKLERDVLIHADCVVSVSPTWTKELRDLGAKRVQTIMNGFDDETGISVPDDKEKKFSILHLGSIPLSRNPEEFWKVLAELVRENHSFASLLQIRLIGKVDLKVIEALETNNLKDFLKYDSFIPHDKTYRQLTAASVLLLIINNTPNSGGILTNKFYEYLSAHRPILALGPVEGDAAKILHDTGAGKIFPYADTDNIKHHLKTLFDLHLQNKLTVSPKEINKFSRKSLTHELSILLDNLTS